MNHFKGQQNPSAMPVDARGEGLSTAHWLPFYRSPSNSDDKNLVWGEKPPQKRINNSRPKKILQKKPRIHFESPPPNPQKRERLRPGASNGRDPKRDGGKREGCGAHFLNPNAEKSSLAAALAAASTAACCTRCGRRGGGAAPPPRLGGGGGESTPAIT